MPEPGRHHDDDGNGVADHAERDSAEHEHQVGGHAYCEDRSDPSSWDDPEIAQAWEDPPEIEPATDLSHLDNPREP